MRVKKSRSQEVVRECGSGRILLAGFLETLISGKFDLGNVPRVELISDLLVQIAALQTWFCSAVQDKEN